MPRPKRIAVLIEEHFDETEVNAFDAFFPKNGYEVEYISKLRGKASLTFMGNDTNQPVTVTKDFAQVNLDQYAGLILVGGYAMDRLRYAELVEEWKDNTPPATCFLRQAMDA